MFPSNALLSKLNTLAKKANQGVIDILAPAECPVYGSKVEEDDFSVAALNLLQSSPVDYGHPMDRLLRRKDSPDIAISMIYGLFSSSKKRLLLNIIHDIKYLGRREFGRKMGRMLGKEIQRVNQLMEDGDLPHLPQPIEYDAIVPLPIHKAKKKERGYNQAEEISKGVADVLDIPLDCTSLLRSRYSTSQTKLSGNERIENIRGCFSISKKSQIKEKRYLLIDDVLTTGATANEAAHTLLLAGANRVDVAVLNLHGLKSYT